MPAKEPDHIVKVLQQRVYEREKQIAELKTQLDILKHIDSDARINKKVSPSSLDPSRQ